MDQHYFEQFVIMSGEVFVEDVFPSCQMLTIKCTSSLNQADITSYGGIGNQGERRTKHVPTNKKRNQAHKETQITEFCLLIDPSLVSHANSHMCLE